MKTLINMPKPCIICGTLCYDESTHKCSGSKARAQGGV